jgi:hypothetical protein
MPACRRTSQHQQLSIPADYCCAQTVGSNKEDVGRLAQQAAILYVSIANAIDPAQANKVLQEKQGPLTVVIECDRLLAMAGSMLNCAIAF